MNNSATICVAKPTDAQDLEKSHAESDWATNGRNPLTSTLARRWTIVFVLAITNFVAYVARLVGLRALDRIVNPTTAP